MKKIADLVDRIDEELEDAKHYAEKSLEYKVDEEMEWSNKFKEMSNDELKHATYIHDLAVQEIRKLEKVYVAPVEMREIWDKQHQKFIERTAWIKQMLSM